MFRTMVKRPGTIPRDIMQNSVWPAIDKHASLRDIWTCHVVWSRVRDPNANFRSKLVRTKGTEHYRFQE